MDKHAFFQSLRAQFNMEHIRNYFMWLNYVNNSKMNFIKNNNNTNIAKNMEQTP